MGEPFLWLSTAERIIGGETQCATEFWFRLRADAKPQGAEDLDEVRVYYSSARFAEVVQFAERLHKMWTPPTSAEMYDDERDEWRDAVRRQREVTFQYEWHFVPAATGSRDTIRVMKVNTQLSRSAPGWTARVTFSNTLIGGARR